MSSVNNANNLNSLRMTHDMWPSISNRSPHVVDIYIFLIAHIESLFNIQYLSLLHPLVEISLKHPVPVIATPSGGDKPKKGLIKGLDLRNKK